MVGRLVRLRTAEPFARGVRDRGPPADQRLEGTLATTALGVAAGVDVVRVHDVQANVRVTRMADAIVRGGWEEADS